LDEDGAYHYELHLVEQLRGDRHYTDILTRAIDRKDFGNPMILDVPIGSFHLSVSEADRYIYHFDVVALNGMVNRGLGNTEFSLYSGPGGAPTFTPPPPPPSEGGSSSGGGTGYASTLRVTNPAPGEYETGPVAFTWQGPYNRYKLVVTEDAGHSVGQWEINGYAHTVRDAAFLYSARDRDTQYQAQLVGLDNSGNHLGSWVRINFYHRATDNEYD
jgi:hypothetical protein